MIRQKRGQMKLSFGMIFSILLIIFFLVFAFLAIQKFLDFQKDITSKKFYESFNHDVESVWTSTQASEKVVYLVPRGTTKVCFINSPSKNVYLYSDVPKLKNFVNHLRIKDNFCINAKSGKVSFILEKNYGDSLVKVKKIE